MPPPNSAAAVRKTITSGSGMPWLAKNETVPENPVILVQPACSITGARISRSASGAIPLKLVVNFRNRFHKL